MNEKITLPHQPKEIIDPIAYAMNVITEISPMGGNDYEFPTIFKYIEDYQQNKISGVELINKVTEIKKAKQQADYH